jgi:hypothetical protein
MVSPLGFNVSMIYLYLKSRTGGGRISACGGNGFAGGGGGRVSVDIFSRHDDPQIFVHGETHHTSLSRVDFYGEIL